MKNILIIGAPRSGKSFLMKSLKLIYKKPYYFESCNADTVIRNINRLDVNKMDALFIDEIKLDSDSIVKLLQFDVDLFISTDKNIDIELFDTIGFKIIECSKDGIYFEHKILK